MKIVLVLCLFSFSVYSADEAPCQVPSHRSVKYECLLSGRSTSDGSRSRAVRDCWGTEPSGAVVSPRCRENYYATTALRYMRCKNGEWDYIAKCIPECGLVTPAGTQLVLGGGSAKRAEVPWHAGIYTKATKPYMQICGGSLISNVIVISAAHCFWGNIEGKLPAKRFTVAVGKLYRPWNEEMDEPQYSDVNELHFPEHYRGSSSFFQADIAVVVLKTPFVYNKFVRPVCVDFDFNFEKIQLQPGKMGKVAGWGLTSAEGEQSQVLKVIDLPYVPTGTCIDQSPDHFRPFITSDKFCAGYKNAGMAVCKGDSGGGLVFPDSGKGYGRHYLRGIVSAAPNEDIYACNANAITSFTQLQAHEHFIKQFWVAEEASSEDKTRPLADIDDIAHNGDCKLPQYPDHGSFVTNIPNATPGQYVNSVVFNVTCNLGYKMEGSSSVFCYNGLWSEEFPKCVGNACIKNGDDGVCTSLGECPSALADLKNKSPIQLCAYGAELIVCCVPLVVSATVPMSVLLSTSTETCEQLPPWGSAEDEWASNRCYIDGKSE